MATTSFPGAVSSGVVGSTYQAMTPEGERRMYELQDQKKKEQEERNAQIRAERAAQQQAAQQAKDQERVHAAFNQIYGPQLQRAYQDTAVQSAPSNSAAGKARDWAIGHGYSSGGTVGQPGTDITSFAAPRLEHQMSQEQVQNTLNTLWSQKTDPYSQAANQLAGGMMKMFHPSDAPAKAWGAAVDSNLSRGVAKKKLTEEKSKGGDESNYLSQML